jgi:membrane protein implicated in regulation of membrane protease activity
VVFVAAFEAVEVVASVVVLTVVSVVVLTVVSVVVLTVVSVVVLTVVSVVAVFVVVVLTRPKLKTKILQPNKQNHRISNMFSSSVVYHILTYLLHRDNRRSRW